MSHQQISPAEHRRYEHRRYKHRYKAEPALVE